MRLRGFFGTRVFPPTLCLALRFSGGFAWSDGPPRAETDDCRAKLKEYRGFIVTISRPRANGTKVLEERMAEVETSGAATACQDRLPSTGKLLVRIHSKDADEGFGEIRYAA